MYFQFLENGAKLKIPSEIKPPENMVFLIPIYPRNKGFNFLKSDLTLNLLSKDLNQQSCSRFIRSSTIWTSWRAGKVGIKNPLFLVSKLRTVALNEWKKHPYTLISLINVELGINVEGVQKLPNH